MRIRIESTTKVVEVNGVPARIWEGHTESGIPIHCMITRIAVDVAEDQAQFEEELAQCRPPRNRDIEAYPMRMLL
ncbi:MAG TPA: hypothetical protein VK611_21640 [Acidimicrobiales bacterium]|nr:hypothetical protein [Acidimicrobiales bacterium]